MSALSPRHQAIANNVWFRARIAGMEASEWLGILNDYGVGRIEDLSRDDFFRFLARIENARAELNRKPMSAGLSR